MFIVLILFENSILNSVCYWVGKKGKSSHGVFYCSNVALICAYLVYMCI